MSMLTAARLRCGSPGRMDEPSVTHTSAPLALGDPVPRPIPPQRSRSCV